MKFSSVILVGLGLFVASCSAACDCKASDQACLNKCVTAANACIVKCESKGDSCQQACISSNWPSFAVMQKDVLASITNTADASAPTGTESLNAADTTNKTSPSSGVESVSLTALSTGTAHSGSGFPSASASSVSGLKPTSASGLKPSTSPKNNAETTNSTGNSTSGSDRSSVIAWSATLAVIIGTTAYVL